MSRESTPLLNSGGGGPIKLPRDKFITLLCTLYFGSFLAAVDSTIVSTLLASIASDLHALDSISWVATAYLVAYSAFQPLYGKLSDIYGSKRILLLSTFLFGLGCQICSMAKGMPLLVIGRLVNGIGAGGVLGVNSITISHYVSARDRGIYQGIGNVVFGCGAASGGIIGSMAQSYKGWRFAFGLQVPLSAISFLVIYINMEPRKPKNTVLDQDTQQAGHIVRRSSFERLDLVGSFSLATFVSLLMLTVTTGGVQFAWTSWTIAAFVVGGASMLGLFFYWETHKALEPVLPMWLLFDRSVLNSCLLNFFGSGIAYTFVYYGPIYLAACLNYTPGMVSRRLLAQFVGGPIGSLGAGLIIRKTGKYWWLMISSCGGLVFASLLWLGLPILPDSLTDTWYWQDSAFLITGLSYVSLLTISLIVLISAFPSHQATATSAQYTFRGSGSSIILALAAAIFNNVLITQLAKNVKGPHAHKIIKKVSKSVEAIRQVPAEYLDGVVESYRVAIVAVFSISCIWSLIVMVNGLFIRELEIESGGNEPASGESSEVSSRSETPA